MKTGTYTITNVSSNKRLNLYSVGVASNGLNVVLYTPDETPEQKWFYDGERLLIGTNRDYCLDRYKVGTYKNNADIWEIDDSDAANQKITFEPCGNYFKIRLTSLIDNSKYYLTSVGNSNGSKNGKLSTSAGNVYWNPLLSDTEENSQNWIINEVNPASNAVTLNGITVPLPEFPVGSYWTTDGTRTGSSKSYNGIECAGFARYVYRCIWGNDEAGISVTEKMLTGSSSDFANISVGARLSCKPKNSSYDNHSMVLLKKTSSGVTVYDANWSTTQYCIVGMRTWTYKEFAEKFEFIKSSSRTPQ